MGDPSLAPSHVYVLAQICMNASPSNRSREVWKQSVLPQLDYNGEALRKTLAGDAITLPSGAVMYKCDTARFDRFFNALSCGMVFTACGEKFLRRKLLLPRARP